MLEASQSRFNGTSFGPQGSIGAVVVAALGAGRPGAAHSAGRGDEDEGAARASGHAATGRHLRAAPIGLRRRGRAVGLGVAVGEEGAGRPCRGRCTVL